MHESRGSLTQFEQETLYFLAETLAVHAEQQQTVFYKQIVEFYGELMVSEVSIKDQAQTSLGPHWGGKKVNYGIRRYYPSLNACLGRLQRKGLVRRGKFPHHPDTKRSVWTLTNLGRLSIGLPPLESVAS